MEPTITSPRTIEPLTVTEELVRALHACRQTLGAIVNSSSIGDVQCIIYNLRSGASILLQADGALERARKELDHAPL